MNENMGMHGGEGATHAPENGSIYPFRVGSHENVHRGLRSSWLQRRDQTPYAILLKAFYRHVERDPDGITVMPHAPNCFALSIKAIARMGVREIDQIHNPATGASLAVIQDEPEHAFIDNVPYYEEIPEDADVVAAELAEIAVVIEDEEFNRARQEWDARRVPTPED